MKCVFNIGRRLEILLFICAAFTFSTKQVYARKTNWTDPQKGVVLGLGQYIDKLSNSSNEYEPIQQIAPSTAQFSALQNYRRYPTRLGIFWGNPYLTTQLYGRYNFNNKTKWKRIDDPEGEGRTTLKGYGIGGQLDMMLVSTSSARLMLSLNLEYISNKASLRYTSEDHQAEHIKLSSNNLLVGAGLTGEVWLIDLWSLGLFAGYHYVQSGQWSVVKPGGNFFGNKQSTGALKLSEQQTPSSSRMGGFLVEASFKLSFYFL